MLPNPGSANLGVLVYVMGPRDQHPTVGISPETGSKIRDEDYRTNSSRQTAAPVRWLLILDWEPLYQRRANAKLVMVYRITYGLIYNPALLYLHPATSRTRGHTLWYMPLYCMTDVYGHSFPPLPPDCRTSSRKASWLPQPELASQGLLFSDCFIILLTCTLF